MEICEAKIEDAAIILQIQKEAYVSEAELHNDFNIPPLTQSLAELECEFNNKCILKVVLNGKIVGSGQVKLNGSTSHIGRMAIKGNYKGLGIGSKLLSALELAYPEADRVELFTGINSKANLNMYERRGYRRIKEETLGKTTVVFLDKVLNTANKQINQDK
ncbi:MULTISPECIES: GNAT family N-acetyltransferase [Pseudoalteromonas]|uniref:GNAT family N-acetyltransferase n=1 Tax=Pseudoalteromonas TaxID=53246 RepID=UPI0006D68967|nr:MULTISPECIES: GNAT family N-acetyltransferase [Pseudoalteromonas]KPZ52648.1 Acetyltransferase (GNAT) family protein [Pseudoalteromonas sp. P1-25]MDO6463043.1 GNAT family N-acetyltransferase [Pseudoalteromonas carrageenovora]MDO6547096.1 GNAT family N-acetyltransferase [Pseudoalteromonas carrageenovora]MDO6831544.1 GNAT family N-acetyltransferase [Pseudoalteromonas carrageenovora]|tara:strand:+ start:244 stop:726 length:483 start_codon:yes stop_codon:yes gene_type:complete